jgi:hypothetical protein
MLTYIDVFVDDFLAAAQGDKARLDHIQRILLKLLQGDAASWETIKKIPWLYH